VNDASSTGFINSSVVNFGADNPVPTTFVSPTQLTAAVPGPAIANPGTIEVTVTTAAPGGGTSNAVPFTVVSAVPTLTITKSHNDPFAQSQQGATYTITVSNTGSGPTSGTVTVTDTLPAGSPVPLTAAAISGSPDSNWSCTLATLTCTRSDPLAAGSSYDPITVTVSVAANAAIGQVTNTAMVSGGGSASNTFNDTTNIVAAAADVGVNIIVSPSSNASSTTVTYTATVNNAGPSEATNVVMTDTLEGNASFVTPPEGCTLTPGPPATLSCNVGTLVNGNQASFTITVQLNGTAGWVSDTVTEASNLPDPTPGDNVAPVHTASVGGNTVTGSNIAVQPVDRTAGTSPAVLTFAKVTRAGSSTLVSASSGPAPPAGFRTGTPAVFYNLATTAGYSGAIGVALGFNGVSFHNPAKVRLFHYENGAWVDRTVAVSATGEFAAGLVGSLSPFALFEPVGLPPVANPGPNLTTAATSALGAKVTLNGSASSDPNGDPLTYRWTGPFPEGNGVATGVNPTVTMPLGANQVTLVVDDGEATSAAVSQTITVTDFSMAAVAVGPTTISAGSSVSFNISASPLFGPFPAAVTLACTGLPQGAQCNFSSATVNAGGPASKLTITTTPRTTTALAPLRHGNPAPLYALWMPLPAILLMGVGTRRRARRRTALLMLLLLLGMTLLLVSCGGGSMGTAPAVQNGTPAGNYTVTITGTTSAGLQNTTSVSFTVQ